MAPVSYGTGKGVIQDRMTGGLDKKDISSEQLESETLQSYSLDFSLPASKSGFQC